jgi:hypothetical protein
MLRGRYSCACSTHAKPSSTSFSLYHFPYRFRLFFNRPAFLYFPTRTVSRTDPSSLYPLFALSLSKPYRKTGGGGKGNDLLANIRVPIWTSLGPCSFRQAGNGNRQERNSRALKPSTLHLEPHFPLTPIIPAHTSHSPVSPMIPALARTPRGEGVKIHPQPSSNTLHLSTHSVNVGAPTFSTSAARLLSTPPHKQDVATGRRTNALKPVLPAVNSHFGGTGPAF